MTPDKPAVRNVPILMYHSISAEAEPRFRKFTVAPERFAQQMAYLKKHDYVPVTVTRYARAMAGEMSGFPDRPVVLTFDDGFADFATTALPVLMRYGFTATVYVATAFVGGRSRWLQREGEAERPILSWAQLRDIKASSIECGGHSHTHAQLDMLPPAVARDEVVRCKSILEEQLGQEVTSFAYPFGYYNALVRRMVQDAGHTSACAVKYALSSAADDRFALARLIVTADTELNEFAALLGAQRWRIAAARDRARSLAWRCVRRCAAAVKRRQEGMVTR